MTADKLKDRSEDLLKHQTREEKKAKRRYELAGACREYILRETDINPLRRKNAASNDSTSSREHTPQ